MNRTIPFALAVLLGFTQCTPPAVGNSRAHHQIVNDVVRAFEQEDSLAFWRAFSQDATWLGTAMNAPDTLRRTQVALAYQKLWDEFDFQLIEPFDLQNAEANSRGSVCGYFHWEISKPDRTDSTASLRIYEVFEFNDMGEIRHVQIYSDLSSAFTFLRSY
jgi:hypothetical protein